MTMGPRILEVDGIESVQAAGISYARRVPLCYSNTTEARKWEEEHGDDPEWDARMQARWDAYSATPESAAYEELARVKHAFHTLDGHETIT